LFKLSSETEQRLKYSYKFTLKAQETSRSPEDPSTKAEIQAYINEVLGIKPKKDSEDIVGTA